jgi:dGTPase
VRIRATKGVLAMLADDVVETTRAALAEAKPTCVDDVRRHSSKLVRLSDRATAMLGELQEFLLRRVYLHPETHEADRAARGIIRELFEAYVARPARLPQRYAQRIERNGLERTVCDFIAGMTDRYCRQAHRELMAKI